MLPRPTSITWGDPIWMTAPFGQPHGNPELEWERSVAVDIDGSGREVVFVSTTPRGHNDRWDGPYPLVALGWRGDRMVDITDEVLPPGIGASLLRGFQVADFNGDGRPDIFLDNTGSEGANPFPGEANGLLLSDGKGGYTDASGRLPGFNDFSHGSVVADFNGDGHMDIFVNNLGGGNDAPAYLLLGDGAGNFSDPLFVRDDSGFFQAGNFDESFQGATTGYYPGLIDWGNDGSADLWFGPMFHWEDGAPVFDGHAIARNDGSGNFSIEHHSQLRPPIPQHRIASGEFAGEHTRWGDIDNDGDLDLLVYWDAMGQGFVLQLLENMGAGGYVDASDRIEGQEGNNRLPNISGTPDFFLVDFDADGDLDIVISRWTPDFSAQRVLWFENDGAGNFQRIAGGAFPGTQSFIFADVNGDGIPDLVSMTAIGDVPNDQPELDLDGHLVSVRLGTIDGPVNRTGWGTDDVIVGGDFNDTLRGAGGDDFLRGNGGDDRLFGGMGHDTLHGGAGDDTLEGGPGRDLLIGGAGDDVLRGGGGNDTLDGGAGDDRLFGGPGADLLRGGPGDDTLQGGGGHDTLQGGGGHDVLRGGAGDDVLRGAGGSDTLFGGPGDDRLFGGAGHDRLEGGPGNDTLRGGNGNDTLVGGRGDDVLWGGDGADVFVFRAGDGNDRIMDFTPGEDVIRINSGAAGFADLTITAQGGATAIAFADVQITLNGVAPGQIGADDFLF